MYERIGHTWKGHTMESAESSDSAKHDVVHQVCEWEGEEGVIMSSMLLFRTFCAVGDHTNRDREWGEILT